MITSFPDTEELAFESLPSKCQPDFPRQALKSAKAQPYFQPDGSSIGRRLSIGSVLHEPDFALRSAIYVFPRPFGDRRQVVRRAGAEQASRPLGAGALVPLPCAPLLAVVGIRAWSDRRRGSERCDGRDRL